MADDASSYPAALDTFTALPALKDGPPSESDFHKKYADAIKQIETELGTNARFRMGRTYANVAARNAAITSPVLGDRAFLTDEVHGQFSDGVNWWPIPQMNCGTTSVTFSAGIGQVNFNPDFTVAPVVTATPFQSGTTEWTLHVHEVTTNYVNFYLRSGGTAYTGTCSISWIAVNGTAEPGP